MYVRIATAQVKPGLLDELSEQMVQGFERAIAQGLQVPGFLAQTSGFRSEQMAQPSFADRDDGSRTCRRPGLQDAQHTHA